MVPSSATIVLNDQETSLSSINNCYGTSRSGHKYLTREAKNFKEIIYLKTKKVIIKPPFAMCIDVTIHKDLDNILKIAIDSMCEKLEINDRKLLELHVYKKEKENYRKDKDKILVSIWML